MHPEGPEMEAISTDIFAGSDARTGVKGTHTKYFLREWLSSHPKAKPHFWDVFLGNPTEQGKGMLVDETEFLMVCSAQVYIYTLHRDL